MGMLRWDKPQKARLSEEHAKMYSSDTNVPGTYMPNMSYEDNRAWKAKLIKTGDRRVEIRKLVGGSQMLIVIRPSGVTISANGKLYMDWPDHQQMQNVIEEAVEALHQSAPPEEQAVWGKTQWGKTQWGKATWQ